MKTVLAPACVLLVAMQSVHAQAPQIADAPKAIQELASVIKDKRPDDVRAEIIKRFGPAKRDIGSGFRIEQWDLFGGILTFHPATGPTFADTKTNKFFRLLRTTNPAGANILDSYEMTTLPDSKNHGTRYWLGNVKFGANSSYQFTNSGQFPEQRAAQTENFFILHPAGTVEVRYVAPITPDTLLESLPEGATIAHLVFSSSDHKHQATFSITSSERDRRLTFRSDKAISFDMDTGWKNCWR